MIFNQSETLRRPNDGDFYFYRGLCYLEIDNYKNAIKDFSAWIKLDPKDEYAYIWCAIAHNDNKDYKKAIADYTQAININANNAQFYYWRANAYHENKNDKKAIADCKKALEIDSSHKQAQELLALLDMPKPPAKPLEIPDWIKPNPRFEFVAGVGIGIDNINFNPPFLLYAGLYGFFMDSMLSDFQKYTFGYSFAYNKYIGIPVGLGWKEITVTYFDNSPGIWAEREKKENQIFMSVGIKIKLMPFFILAQYQTNNNFEFLFGLEFGLTDNE